MIKFMSLEFLGLSHRIPGKIKNAVHSFEISAFVPKIFKFEKYAKYANERTDDVIHSTQYNIKCINRPISVNFQQRPLKLGMVGSSTGNTPTAVRNFVPMAMHSFPGSPI